MSHPKKRKMTTKILRQNGPNFWPKMKSIYTLEGNDYISHLRKSLNSLDFGRGYVSSFPVGDLRKNFSPKKMPALKLSFLHFVNSKRKGEKRPPFCSIQPLYNAYMWYMLVYISCTLPRESPTFPFFKKKHKSGSFNIYDYDVECCRFQVAFSRKKSGFHMEGKCCEKTI